MLIHTLFDGLRLFFTAALLAALALLHGQMQKPMEQISRAAEYDITSPLGQQAKLTAADAAEGNDFGRSVVMSGDTVVVGAPFGVAGTVSDAGAAYVFQRSGSAWSQQAKLTAADTAARDRFGGSVAISGDTVVVGALLGTAGVYADAGAAYVFQRSGSTWSQQAKLAAAEVEALDRFGASVAISGDTIVVGSPFVKDDMHSSTAAAHVHHSSGST